MPNTSRYSIVIPVYQNRESLPELLQALDEVEDLARRSEGAGNPFAEEEAAGLLQRVKAARRAYREILRQHSSSPDADAAQRAR